MANKTQIRVQQLTGSIADLAYSGSQSSPGNADGYVLADLGGALGEFAGAIGRITGKNSTGASAFTNVTAGHFHQSLHVTGSGLDFNQTSYINAAAGNLSLKATAGQLKLIAGGDGLVRFISGSGPGSLRMTMDMGTTEDDVIFKDADSAEVFRIDGSETSLLMADDRELQFGDANSYIRSNDSGNLQLSGSAHMRLHVALGDVEIDTPTGEIQLDADGTGQSRWVASAGTLKLESGKTGASALLLSASHAAGGVNISAGTGDIVMLSDDKASLTTVGTITLNTTAGTISIGSNDVDQDINIGTQGERTVSISTGAFASTVNIGNGTGASAVRLEAGTGDITIGTNAIAHEVTIGNSTGDSGITATAGTGGIDIDAQGDITIDAGTTSAISLDASAASNFSTSAGDLTLQSSAASVNITGAEAAADAIVLNASNAAGGIDLSVGSAVKVSLDSNSMDVSSGVQLNVDDTTASTSTSTGALVVDGGIGVAGDLNVGGDIVLTDDLDVSGLTTLRGDLQVLGTTTTVSSSNTEFADGLIGLNYSGTTTGIDRDVGLILGLASGNKAFFWDNSASGFRLGDTSNDPDDAAIAISGGSDLGLANLQLFGADGGGNYSKIMASGSSDAILIKHDNSELVFDAATITMSGTQLNGDTDEQRTLWGIQATNPIVLGGGAIVKTAGNLQVDGGVIQDSGGDARIGFPDTGDLTLKDKDGSTALTVNGTNSFVSTAADLSVGGNLDLDGNIIRNSGDSNMIVFNGANLVLSASGGSMKWITDETSDSELTIDLSMQNVTWQTSGSTAGGEDGGPSSDGFKFEDKNVGGNYAYIGAQGFELAQDYNNDNPMFKTSVENSSGNFVSPFMAYSETGTVGMITGSHIMGRSSGEVSQGATDSPTYLKLSADNVTGSAGSSGSIAHGGGLFFHDGGFSLKAENYSWDQGILFASGSSDYDGFITEFGSSATLLSALAAGAGGSATRDDNVIVSQVVAGSTTTLAADLSDVPESGANTRVQVYVNGQLMLSGADGSNDYTLVAYGASTNANFQFDVEIDDVISVLAK